MCLHSKVHRSMLLVSLRYVQYSMCRATNFKVHYAMLLLLCGKVRYQWLCYAGSSLVLHSKMQCRQFHYQITLCSIFYVPSDKFQSALCYAGPSLVLHSKMQSNSSMALVVVYHVLFSWSNVLF